MVGEFSPCQFLRKRTISSDGMRRENHFVASQMRAGEISPSASAEREEVASLFQEEIRSAE